MSQSLSTTALWNLSTDSTMLSSNHSFVLSQTFKEEFYRYLVPALLTIAAAAFLLNGYILMSIKWLRRPVSANLCLSLSLAAADAWTSALILTILVINSYLPFVFSVQLPYCLRLFLENARMGGLLTSVLHLLALALNHCYGTVYPLRHMRLVTGTLIKYSLLALWITPTLLTVLVGFCFEGQFYRSPNCQSIDIVDTFGYRISFSAMFFIPMTLTFGLYLRILGQLKKKAGDPMLAECHRINSAKKHNKKLFVTMLLLMGSFLVCWMPTILTFCLICIRGCLIHPRSIPESVHVALFSTALVLIILKLFTNPLIYANRIIELRYAMWRMRESRWPFTAVSTTKLPKEFESFVMNKRDSTSSYRVKLGSSRPSSRKASAAPLRSSKNEAFRRLLDNEEVMKMGMDCEYGDVPL